ncbi:7TM diverse intracellular signaling domain-containing protein [Paraflavisolibacter sp. H34]|uniref:sensor histidine kinase n=1 Tax=Huijunlia imazamoxiresistens TaxID=3127457 RepID=UPI003018EFBF
MPTAVYRSLLVFLVFLLGYHSSRAQPAGGGSFYVWEDAGKQLGSDDAWALWQRHQFKKLPAGHHNIGFTRSVYWLAFVNDTDNPIDTLLWQIGDHHINRIDFFASSGGRPQLQFTTGDRFPFRQRPVKAAGFYFPVSRKGVYLARVDKANESLQLFSGLISREAVTERELADTAILSLLTGFVLLLVLFSLYLFGFTGDRLYLLYLLYVAAVWLWVLSNSGFAFQYLWPAATSFTSKSRFVFTLSSVALSVPFMLRYTGGLASRAARLFARGLQWVLWPAILGMLLYENRESSYWWGFQFFFSAVVLAYAVFALSLLGYKAWKGNRLAQFYLAAIAGFMVLALLQLAFYTGYFNHLDSFLSRFGYSAGFIAELVILMAGLVYRFNQYRLERERLLRQVAERQQENTRVIMEVQESERSRIANQLHDVAGSLLSAAKLNLSSLTEQPHSPEETVLRLKKAEEAVSMVSDTVRGLSHALSPVMLGKTGFRQTLENVVSIFNAAGKIRIGLVVMGFETYRPELHAFYTGFYAIIYELLNNVVRHSRARHALVQVAEHDQSYCIIVEDDGIGMDPALALQRQTLGLGAISSKIDYFGGSIAFDRNDPQGLIITIEIPVVRHAQKTFTP